MKKSKIKSRNLVLGIIFALIAGITATTILFQHQTVDVNATLPYDNTFLTVRSGIASHVGNVNRWTFATHEFQNNQGRFSLIHDSAIASVIDSRHGISLARQSHIIRQQSRVSSDPMLTIITHGQGGQSSDWSNTGSASSPRTLQYRTNSLIEVLRREHSANVYVARSYLFDLDYTVNRQNIAAHQDNYINAHNDSNRSSQIVHLFPGRAGFRAGLTRPLISLFPLETTNYNSVHNAIENGTNNGRLTTFRNPNRHNIIVFESRDPLQYRNFVYNEINSILTMLSYDVFRASGQVPLVDMIGHSTGAVWNMMWASRQHFNVRYQFSIGAPFNGSRTGAYSRNWWLQNPGIEGAWLLWDAISLINNPSAFDNTDLWGAGILGPRNGARARDLRWHWGNAVWRNPNLRLFAMAGDTCTRMVPSHVYIAKRAVPGVRAHFENNSVSRSCCRWLLNCTVIFDDFAIARYSAWAYDFSNVTTWNKTFDNNSNNSRSMRAHPDMYGVSHNLLTKDSEVIAHIRNTIRLGSFNFNASTGTITGIGTRKVRNGNISIPAYIGNNRVTSISASAFLWNTNVARAYVPSSVTSIGSNAFPSGATVVLSNLALPTNFHGTLNISHGITAIGAHTFESNTRVIGISLPNSITSILYRAFFESQLSTVTIPTTVNYIARSAFSNSRRLTRVNMQRAAFSAAQVPTLGGFAFAGAGANFSRFEVWLPCWDSIHWYSLAPFWTATANAGQFRTNAPVPPTWGISLSHTNHTFHMEQGSNPPQLSVRVNNTGNQATGALNISVATTGGNANSFVIPASLGSIGANGHTFLAVRPAANLPVGTHSARITISGSNGISAILNVSVVVSEPPPPPEWITVWFSWTESSASINFEFTALLSPSNVLGQICGRTFSGHGGLGARGGTWYYIYHIHVANAASGEIIAFGTNGWEVAHVWGGEFFIGSHSFGAGNYLSSDGMLQSSMQLTSHNATRPKLLATTIYALKPYVWVGYMAS